MFKCSNSRSSFNWAPECANVVWVVIDLYQTFKTIISFLIISVYVLLKNINCILITEK